MKNDNMPYDFCQQRKVYRTKNYDMFKFSDKNRKFDDYKYILESIKKVDLLESHPILVDSSLMILDGQHRLAVARELNKYIYFTIDSVAKEDHIPLLQIQKAWHLNDYAHFYRDSIPDYRYMDEIAKKYNLGHAFVMNCCSKITIGLTKMFKEGKFKLSYPKKDLDNKFEMIKDLIISIQKIIKKTVLKNVLHALWHLIDLENYCHEHFLKNIDSYPNYVISASKMQNMADIHNLLAIQVYNRNLKDEKKKLKIIEYKVRLFKSPKLNQLSLVV